MKILLLEKDYIETNTVMPKHSHAFWQLDFFDTVRSGVTVHVNGRKYPMSSNEFIMIKPYDEHKLVISRRSLAFTLKFELEDVFTRQLQSSVIPTDRNGDILRYFLADSTMAFKTGPQIMEHLLWIFLLRNFEDVFADRSGRVTVKDARISTVVDYMRNNITGEWALSDFAGMANMSVSHFIKVFRDETGMPPLAYLNSMKIERAKQLLKYSDMTISMLADSLKYPDIYSFSRAFKRACGSSPSLYRRTERG